MGIDVWQLREQPEDDEDKVPSTEIQSSAIETIETHAEIKEKDDDAPMDFGTLQSAVSQCQACRLSERRTQTVFGAGNEAADLMIIGEAPGEEEDRQGQPFVGRAGKLLSSMLFAMGLEREKVYITNVVKCRPPNNRDPHPQEAAACSQYLKRQIEMISPKLILAVGRVSAQLLLDTEISLGRLRGQLHKYQDTGTDLIVTYHPAYLLRKPSAKAQSWDDLWEVKMKLESKPS